MLHRCIVGLFAFFLAFGAVPSRGENTDLALFHWNIAGKERLTVIRAESAEKLEALQKNIAAIKSEKNAAKLPPLVSERIEKRLQISDRLEQIIRDNLSKTDADSSFYVKRALLDLEIFVRYFKDELAYGKMRMHLGEPQKYSVRDFGAKGDGVTDDTPAFERALTAIRKAGGKNAVLLIPKGKYLFQSLMHAQGTRNLFGERAFPCAKVNRLHSNNRYFTKYIHLLVADLDHLTIQGETPDTELIFSQPEIGVLIAGCEDLKIKNLTLRCALKTHTQGILEKHNPKEKSLIIKIEDGYPTPDDPNWKLVRDTTAQSYDANGLLKREGTDILVFNPWRFEALGNRRYKMFFSSSRYRAIPEGIRIAFPVRQDRQSMVATKRSRFVTLDTVRVLNAGASALPSSESYVVSYVNCQIIPADGALMSSAADGSINADNFFGIYFKNCKFRNFGDDAVNVFGYGGHVLEHKGNRLLVDLGRLYDGEEVRPGETLVLKRPLWVYIVDNDNGKIKGMARVVSVKAIPGTNLPIHEYVLDGDIAADAIRTAKTLAPELDWLAYRKKANDAEQARRKKMGAGAHVLKPDQVFFFQESGIGTVVSGCHFRNNRHNNITMQAANALLENNSLGDCSDFGILIASYFRGLGGWREGALPYNVVIRNNEITNTFIPISLWYSIAKGKFAPNAGFRDILLENNQIAGGVRGLDLYNVNGLTLRNNTCKDLAFIRFASAQNCISENNLWNKEALSAFVFKEPSAVNGKFKFVVNDPNFTGRKPTSASIPMQSYFWSKTPGCMSQKREADRIVVTILKSPDLSGKMEPAYLQSGFLCPVLPEGMYRVTSSITASADTEILVLAEIPGQKAFALQKMKLSAGVKTPILFQVVISKEIKGKEMRCLAVFLGKAAPGTVLEYAKPSITFAQP
ncbi:MAG: glycosyl hydrolase family 28-related protein [Victivallaceae bacterium]|nr:glycosyl hydrolase family 28-related protein [Victivallaceae bacterium]